MLRSLLPAVSCAAVLCMSALVFAQTPARPGDGPAVFVPFGPGFAPTNPLDDVKKQIGSTDEEWKVIGPKLQKVIAARQVIAADARGPDNNSPFRFGAFPGPGFAGPGAGFSGPGFPGPGFGGPGGPPGGSGPFPAPPGGFPGLPQPGQVLPPPVQDTLKLTAEQKKQLEELQKEVDSKLDKLLTDDQRKQLAQMRQGFGPPGGAPSGPPAGADAPPKNDNPPKSTSPATPASPGGVTVLPGPSPSGNAIGQARADLKTVLDDPKHSSADVQEKIDAVRRARQKARADLEAAQKDLRQMLTAEQEAVLISLGYLD